MDDLVPIIQADMDSVSFTGMFGKRLKHRSLEYLAELPEICEYLVGLDLSLIDVGGDASQLTLPETGSLEYLAELPEICEYLVELDLSLIDVGGDASQLTLPETGTLQQLQQLDLTLPATGTLQQLQHLALPFCQALTDLPSRIGSTILFGEIISTILFHEIISFPAFSGSEAILVIISKAPSGSLEFRSIYISIVLFQGAYVWIKFREVAPPSQQKPSPGLYRKCTTNELGVKVYYGNFEPRFKPPCSKSYISVGSYEDEQDAKNIYQILAFYYGKDVPSELPLPFGDPFHVPPMNEEEQRLSPEEKKKWAKGKVKAVYEDYKREESAAWDSLLDQPTGDLPNTVLPLPEFADASAGVVGRMDSIGIQGDEAHPFQFGNQGDNLGRDISPSNPNIGPVTQGMQEHMANNTLSGHVGGGASQLTLPETATNIPANGAGAPGEQPIGAQFQLGSLQENQANNSTNNLVLDDLSLVRLVKELQRQQQLQQFRSQQLESRIQQQETRISELERQQQLEEFQSHQKDSRISELEVEVERLRSTEHARKRSCSGLTPRHNSED
jgi:hypothetical protein